LRFFGETTIQNYKVLPIQKTQYPKYVIALLGPNFPKVINALKFLEKFSRYNIELFYGIKHKCDRFKLFVRQRIKIFFNRAFARFEFIKFDFSHRRMFAHVRTSCKDFIHRKTHNKALKADSSMLGKLEIIAVFIFSATFRQAVTLNPPLVSLLLAVYHKDKG
jgi:hypothetical protein